MEHVGRQDGMTVQELVKLMEGNSQVMDMLRSCRNGRYEPERT